MPWYNANSEDTVLLGAETPMARERDTPEVTIDTGRLNRQI
jgi:hypothetical protein